MNELFSPDSKLIQGMTRAADLLILNLLFLVTSLPVVTIGASAAALYSVMFAMNSGQEKGTVMPYFRAFRENFRQATIVWLILLFAAVAIIADMVLVANMVAFEWMNAVFGILLLVELLGSAVIFPLMSLFDNTVLGTLKNGIIIGLGQLPRAAMVAALWCFPVLVLFRLPMVFFYAGFLWAAVWFSGAAYLSSIALRKVFAPYLPENNEEVTE